MRSQNYENYNTTIKKCFGCALEFFLNIPNSTLSKYSRIANEIHLPIHLYIQRENNEHYRHNL